MRPTIRAGDSPIAGHPVRGRGIGPADYLRQPGEPAARACVGTTAEDRPLHQLAPRDPVYDVETMADRIGTASAQTRLTATLLGLFAAIALGLATMGIYGVISFGVAQRSCEIGVRMALGAGRNDVLGMVLRDGLWLIAAGTLVGLGGAYLTSRVLRTLLFGIQPDDRVTLVVIIFFLGGATLLATWWPARRATTVNPVDGLRR